MRCIRFFSWVEILQNSESAVNLVRRANKSCKLTKVTVAKCRTSLGGLDLEQDMPPHQPRAQVDWTIVVRTASNGYHPARKPRSTKALGRVADQLQVVGGHHVFLPIEDLGRSHQERPRYQDIGMSLGVNVLVGLVFVVMISVSEDSRTSSRGR